MVCNSHRADAPTVVFMPHGSAVMYHNFCLANWSVDQLQRIVLIGNSFAAYADKAELATTGVGEEVNLLLDIDYHYCNFRLNHVICICSALHKNLDFYA